MQKIWLIGCGRMGSAMLRGWLKNESSQFFVIIDHHTETLRSTFTNSNVAIYDSLGEALAKEPVSNVVIFAVKPDHIENLLEEYAAPLKAMNPLFMSVIAGKKMALYEQYLGEKIRLIRLMPNTPGAIGKGVTAAMQNDFATKKDTMLCQKLFRPLGQFIWAKGDVDLNKVTAVSGSGPAYVFLFMEAMMNKAMALGFERDQAKQLVIETVLGAAEFAKTSEESMTELRLNVTSPNGTTEKAIDILENSRGNMRELIAEAMEACHVRSIEMSK